MSITRRRFLQGTLAAGAGAALPAFYINKALAQDNTLRIYAWAGYFTDEMLADFREKTGINATFTPYGTNDELMNSLRATDGSGFVVQGVGCPAVRYEGGHGERQSVGEPGKAERRVASLQGGRHRRRHEL